MERRVERSIIDKFVDENGPDGLARLAIKCGVSTSTLASTRAGYVPKKGSTRRDICLGLDVSEDELFPVMPDGAEQAS